MSRPNVANLYVDLDECPLTLVEEVHLHNGETICGARTTCHANNNILCFATKDQIRACITFAIAETRRVASIVIYEMRKGRALLHSVGPYMLSRFMTKEW